MREQGVRRAVHDVSAGSAGLRRVRPAQAVQRDRRMRARARPVPRRRRRARRHGRFGRRPARSALRPIGIGGRTAGASLVWWVALLPSPDKSRNTRRRSRTLGVRADSGRPGPKGRPDVRVANDGNLLGRDVVRTSGTRRFPAKHHEDTDGWLHRDAMIACRKARPTVHSHCNPGAKILGNRTSSGVRSAGSLEEKNSPFAAIAANVPVPNATKRWLR